jgi:molybdenum cofactor biosynthesis protein A
LLTDNHGRRINYLRLAVTDRCNLRCFYCMPEEGLNWLSRTELMSYDEMLRICRLLVGMGIEKIRITGGEPFVRKDIVPFLTRLSQIEGLQELTITTNGVLTEQYIPQLKAIAIKTVNLSLDTLDAARFFAITGRDEFAKVLGTMHALLEQGIRVKINAVVMDGKNTDDIIPLAELTRDLPIDVRFIEEMPFNGDGHVYGGLQWDHVRILQQLTERFPGIEKLADPAYSTSYNYQVPGHKGMVGIIAAYSRTFCGTCNRGRITLKTCLYDAGGLNLKEMMRLGMNDDAITEAILSAFGNRAKDGWEAEGLRVNNKNVHESMATIGG